MLQVLPTYIGTGRRPGEAPPNYSAFRHISVYAVVSGPIKYAKIGIHGVTDERLDDDV